MGDWREREELPITVVAKLSCADVLGLARFFLRRFVLDLVILMGTLPMTLDLGSLAKAYLPVV